MIQGLTSSRLGYVIAVLIPFFAISIYTIGIQTPRFQSQASLVIEQDETYAGVPQLDLGLLSVAGSAEKTDALMMQSFIQSRRLYEELNTRYDLETQWKSGDVDWLSRLDVDASAEEQWEYYRDKLRVEIDPESQILTVSIQAFKPSMAQALLLDIVDSSESFINEISQNLARTQVRFVENELEQAHHRVTEAAEGLLQFQGRSEVMSPEAEVQASLQILGELQARRSGLQTELSALLTYLNDAAPDVVSVRRRLEAIDMQIDRERFRQTGTDEAGLNRLLVDYKEAEMSAQLASDIYRVGLQTLETTRLEASRKGKFVVHIDPPSLPEEASYPDVFRTLLLAVLALNLLYFLTHLVWAAILEHSD